MIWEVMKREAAWREVFGYIAVVIAMSVVLPEHAPAIFLFVVGLCWIRSLPGERASLFQAGLPIAAADLYLGRVSSFLALIWLPGAAGAGTLLLTGRNENAGVMLLGAMGLSVLVLAALSHRVREREGSQWIPSISMALFAGLAWPATLYIPRQALAILCAVAGVLLFTVSWMRIPPGFEVVASKPDQVWDRTLTTGVRSDSRWFGKQWLPLLRGAFPPTAFMFLPIIVMQNIGGQWSYASSQALFPMLMALPRLVWVRALPVARSTLFALLVAPWLLVLAMNLTAGSIFFPSKTPIQYDYVADKLGSVRPPLEFWRVAPAGIAPMIEAPWHETWRPPVQTVAGIAIYNPYSMGASNSRRFLEWQYRRATLAIYGQEIPFNDYHPTTLRPLEQQPRFVVVNVAACLCWLLVLVNAVFLAMHWRVGIHFPRAAHFAAFLVLIPMLVPFILEVLVTHPGNSLGTALMNAVLLRVLASLPDGIAPVLVVAIMPLGILWWSALRLFGGVETQPADPTLRA